jgi:hypothetical protein
LKQSRQPANLVRVTLVPPPISIVFAIEARLDASLKLRAAQQAPGMPRRDSLALDTVECVKNCAGRRTDWKNGATKDRLRVATLETAASSFRTDWDDGYLAKVSDIALIEIRASLRQ